MYLTAAACGYLPDEPRLRGAGRTGTSHPRGGERSHRRLAEGVGRLRHLLVDGYMKRQRTSDPASPPSNSTMERCLVAICSSAEDELNVLAAAIERRRNILQGRGAAAASATLSPTAAAATASATPAIARHMTRDEFLIELQQQEEGPKLANVPDWAQTYVDGVVTTMSAAMSHLRAARLSVEEEAALNSETKADYISAKAIELEYLERISDEAAVAVRAGRNSRNRRQEVPVKPLSEWALKISQSVFAGSNRETGHSNLRMDSCDMAAARDMFLQLVEDKLCRQWLQDPHVSFSYFCSCIAINVLIMLESRYSGMGARYSLTNWIKLIALRHCCLA